MLLLENLDILRELLNQRSLDEKIYKFRVVIPKEQENARTPENSFINSRIKFNWC